MKRSLFLSAVLLGLTASASAWADDGDPPVTPAEPAPAPEPADPEPPQQAPEPALTTGTPVPAAPAADTPQEAAKETSAAPKRRPFAGSSLFFAQSMTTNTVFRGQTQYYDPTVESSLYILPRYAINDAWQVRLRLVANYEWTNNDENTYAHEPTLSDTTLWLWYRKIPQFYGIQPSLAANLGLPTSKNSRARTLVVNPGINGQLVRAWEHFFGGELDVIGGLTYSHPLYRSRQPEVLGQPAVPFQCVGGTNCSDLLSGTMNISDSIAYSLIVTTEWGKWSPALAYIGTSAWAYHPKETNNPVDGRPIPTGADETNYRQTHYLSAWLDYNFTPWITGEIGYWNAVSGIGIDGQRSNIIFDRYQDTRVYLAASVQLDNLFKLLQGTEEGQGGVVRAQNRSPVMTF